LVLDDELARLPDTLRAPLVLCYLEGLTHDEAAQHLGWPVGTVRSRMARARNRLRARLTRRGFTGDEAVWTNTLTAPPLSSALIDATVKVSLKFASLKAAAAVTSASAVALAQGVLKAMTLAKFKVLGAAALACVIAVGGMRTYAYQFPGQPAATPDQATPKSADAPAELLRKIDRFQAELAAAARRNAELQKQVQDLRAELETLRSGTPPGTAKKPGAGADPIAKDGGEIGEPEVEFPRPTGPTYCRIKDDLLMVISPEGEKVVVYNTATKKAKSVRLSEDKKTPLQVTPLYGPGVVALMVQGPKITRVAAFALGDLTWYPVDLREPVEVASPMVDPRGVTYALGRRYYIFDQTSKRWDILEMPEGPRVTPIFHPNGSITYEHDGHIYTFNRKSGKWDDLDTRTILDAPEDPNDAKPKAGSTP
jgi:hypothetical protein